MTQTELDRAVSRITGESRQTVRCHGFSLLTDLPQESDEGSFPLESDSDQQDSTAIADEARRISLAECA